MDGAREGNRFGSITTVIDLPCFHNSSRFGSHMNDEDLKQKAMAFHQLWQHRLPVLTLAAQIRPEQIVFNA